MSKETSKADLARIRIALCGLNRQVLLPVRSELMNLGYRSTEWIRSDEELRQWLQVGIPDLIVADHEVDNGAAIKTIREVRHGDIGENPFVVTIMTTWAHDPETVRYAINSGVDDLIVAPYSTGQLLDRIRKLIEARKPFIATSDYIGPERRRDPNRKSSIPTFEPPNTLQIRQNGGRVDIHDIKEEIARTKTAIMEEKVRRVGFQISFLVDLIQPYFGIGEFDQDTIRNIERLAVMSEEAVKRLAGTKYEPVSQLCRSMHKLSRKIADAPESASSDDVELLKPLSRAILEAFYPNVKTGDLVNQITGAISDYSKRQEAKAAQTATVGGANRKGPGSK